MTWCETFLVMAGCIAFAVPTGSWLNWMERRAQRDMSWIDPIGQRDSIRVAKAVMLSPSSFIQNFISTGIMFTIPVVLTKLLFDLSILPFIMGLYTLASLWMYFASTAYTDKKLRNMQ